MESWNWSVVPFPTDSTQDSYCLPTNHCTNMSGLVQTADPARKKGNQHNSVLNYERVNTINFVLISTLFNFTVHQPIVARSWWLSTFPHGQQFLPFQVIWTEHLLSVRESDCEAWDSAASIPEKTLALLESGLWYRFRVSFSFSYFLGAMIEQYLEKKTEHRIIEFLVSKVQKFYNFCHTGGALNQGGWFVIVLLYQIRGRFGGVQIDILLNPGILVCDLLVLVEMFFGLFWFRMINCLQMQSVWCLVV